MVPATSHILMADSQKLRFSTQSIHKGIKLCSDCLLSKIEQAYQPELVQCASNGCVQSCEMYIFEILMKYCTKHVSASSIRQNCLKRGLL